MIKWKFGENPTMVMVDKNPMSIRRVTPKILGTTSNELLGEKIPKRTVNGSNGRLGQNFETISKLPRRQQTKILDVVEALLAQQTTSS